MNHRKNLVALAILLSLTTLFAAANLGSNNVLPKITPVLAVATCPNGGSANPCDMVSLDAMSRPTKTAVVNVCAVPTGQFGVCDTLINPAVTNVTTFRVGAIVNASSAGAVNGLYGWQYSITYNTSIVTPAGDPSQFCTAYPDCGEKAVWFGSQTNAGNVNWAGALNIGAGNRGGATAVVTIAEDPVTHVGKITIAWAFVAPSTAVNLTARSVLASVSFELTGKGVATFTIGDVIFSDINSIPFSGVIAAPTATCTALVCGAPKVTVTNDPPHAIFTAGHTGTAYTFMSTSTDDVGIKYGVWDFGDKTPFLNTTATTVTHDYGISGARTAPGAFNVTLRVVDTQGATGTARDAGGLPVTNIQPSHQFVNIGLVERAPQPAFIFTPSNPNAGQAVNFDASSSTYPSEPLLAGTAPVGGTGLVSSSAGDSACNLTIGVPCTLGYVDNNANGIFDPGIDTVVRGNDGTGLCNPGQCDILAGPAITPAGQGIAADGKIAWWDTNADASVSAGEPVIYDTNGNTLYDGIKTYSWNFGDPASGASNTATGITATHTFNPTMTTPFTVTLTTADNVGGSNSTTRVVTVTAVSAKHNTTTAVVCSPPTVAINQATTCTATVNDRQSGATTPAGMVSFTRVNTSTATGTFSNTPCNLVALNSSAATCFATFLPTSTGSLIANAYSPPNETTHNGSFGLSNTVTVALRSTSTVVTCSPASVAVGQQVTCTVFVKDNISPGTASTPAGSVAITKGGTATGTFSACSSPLTVVNATTASCTATVTPSTTGTITATGVYTPSDNVHSTSTSPVSNTVTVGLRATSTVVTCSPASVAVGQQVTCTADVNDVAAGTRSTPVGTVSFSNGGSATPLGAFSGTCVSFNATDSRCTATITPTSTGNTIDSSSYTATDGVHSNSGPATSNTVTVGTRATSTVVTCAPSSVAVGQVITCTVFVKDNISPGTASTPAGSVVVSNNGNAVGTFSACSSPLTVVNATTASCTATVTPSTTGSIIGSATYTPSDNVHSGSSGTSNTVNVGGTRATVIVVTCSPASVVVGQQVTCTADVNDVAAGTRSTPVGTVSFSNGGSATPLGAFSGTCVSFNATDSRCTATITPTSTGNIIDSSSYTATDGVHSNSGPATSNTVTVGTRATSTVVTCSPSSVAVGQQVTCTVFVKDNISPGTASTPAGSVVVSNNGNAVGTFSACSSPLTVVNATTASCTATVTPSTTGSIIGSATYTPSDNVHSGSSGTSNTVNVGGTRATVIVVTCSPASVVVGQQVTCTADVNDVAAGTRSTPVGTVSFSNGGSATPLGAFSGTCVSFKATDSRCTATITPTITFNIIDSSSYTATDGVHSNSGPATSNTVTVGTRATSTVVTCAPSSVAVGQVITCTVFVKDNISPGTASTPAGSVVVSNNGNAVGTFSACSSPLTVVNATTASCTATVTPSTTGSIIGSATYTPSDNVHSGSSGTSNTVNVGGTRATVIVVTCSPASVVVGQQVTCTADVNDVAAGTRSTPVGTVSFSNGGSATPLGAFSGTCVSFKATDSRCTATITPTITFNIIDSSSYTATDGVHSNSGPATSNTVTVG